MTDREFKEKILAEIERLHREVYKSLVFNGQAKFALDRVVDFINSLPEEPVCDNRKEAVLKKAHELANRAELISDKFQKSTLIAIAIDMAEWCDSHPIEEPISEVLDEAAEDFAYREWDGLHDEDGGPLFTGDYIQYSFREGAQWQKQQTISKAVEWLQRNIDSRDWLMEFRKVLEE